MVYDLGGGTLDVTVLCIENGGEFEVLSTNGDTHLGGQDFDNALLNHCCFKFKHDTGIGVKNEKRALHRLALQCETAKKMLSAGFETTIDVEELCQGKDFQLKVTRALFEDICKELLDKCIAPVDNAMKDSKLNKGQIDEIVMVGGSSRIPRV